ncbi:hypothetical protein GWK47_015445 [Chionoecetes opilio]|uniref:Uncharacterized protein n=1 Tax=Chionoecetes opilio TaxID=41210 RepID=A0A8J4XSG1_CHIOP|nr:hypothetical protein GWK47_015445 [Chionoecetes opilio]
MDHWDTRGPLVDHWDTRGSLVDHWGTRGPLVDHWDTTGHLHASEVLADCSGRSREGGRVSGKVQTCKGMLSALPRTCQGKLSQHSGSVTSPRVLDAGEFSKRHHRHASHRGATVQASG